MKKSFISIMLSLSMLFLVSCSLATIGSQQNRLFHPNDPTLSDQTPSTSSVQKGLSEDRFSTPDAVDIPPIRLTEDQRSYLHSLLLNHTYSMGLETPDCNQVFEINLCLSPDTERLPVELTDSAQTGWTQRLDLKSSDSLLEDTELDADADGTFVYAVFLFRLPKSISELGGPIGITASGTNLIANFTVSSEVRAGETPILAIAKIRKSAIGDTVNGIQICIRSNETTCE